MKPITQSKLESFIERFVDTLIAFCVSFIIWIAIAAANPNIQTSHTENLGIMLIFTVSSVIRGYIVRRYFNKRLHDKIHRILNDG